MKYPYSTQIVAIQKVRTLLSGLTSLMQDEKWEGINDIMNDCGSTIAALNISDPYARIKDLESTLKTIKAMLYDEHASAQEKIIDIKKEVTTL